jgi:hypothetical protein
MQSERIARITWWEGEISSLVMQVEGMTRLFLARLVSSGCEASLVTDAGPCFRDFFFPFWIGDLKIREKVKRIVLDL